MNVVWLYWVGNNQIYQKLKKKWICIVFIAFTCGNSVYIDDDSLVSRLSICKFFSAAKTHWEVPRKRFMSFCEDCAFWSGLNGEFLLQMGLSRCYHCYPKWSGYWRDIFAVGQFRNVWNPDRGFLASLGCILAPPPSNHNYSDSSAFTVSITSGDYLSQIVITKWSFL